MTTRKERILSRLQELNAGPKRSLGQNFLISDHVIEKIIFAVKAEPYSELIEVGPGLGALTEDLVDVACASQKRLTLIELDKAFAQEWRVRAEAEAGASIRVIEADALQIEWSELNLPPQTLFVSNLPYQISSTIAIERSIEPAGVSRMILMFQKEVAQRIGAKAKSPEYGLLTVIVQAFWEPSTVVDARPQDFHPAPNVSSRVLVFRRRAEPDFVTGSAKGFLRFAKTGFSHRRKLLAKNLAGEPHASKLEEAFVAMKLLPTARAEELSPAQFIELYRRINS